MGMPLRIEAADRDQERNGATGTVRLPDVSPLPATPRASSRLIFPGIASDGIPEPEPEVIASAVSDTVAIPEPTAAPEPVVVAPAPVNVAAAAIDDFLAGSPLEGMGNTFIAAALAHGLDPRLMAAVSLWESGRCGFQAAPFNCWGLTTGERTPSGGLVFRAFASYEEAIWAVTETFAGYGLPTYAALCMWVSGRANCDSDYPGKVLNTMEGIR